MLRGRVTGKREYVFHGTVKCTRCGAVSVKTYREPKSVEATIVVSRMGNSERRMIELPPEEVVEVGKRLQVDGARVEVTSIEKDGVRLTRCKASDVDTVWAKSVDKVRVKISVGLGTRTLSRQVFVAPEETFSVGQVLELDGRRMIIQGIGLGGRAVRKGSASAEEISRLYVKPLRTPVSARRRTGA